MQSQFAYSRSVLCNSMDIHTHTHRTKPNNYPCWLWWSTEPGNDITAWAPHVCWKLLGPMGVWPTQQHCRYRCSHANTNLFHTKSTAAPSTVTTSATFQLTAHRQLHTYVRSCHKRERLHIITN